MIATSFIQLTGEYTQVQRASRGSVYGIWYRGMLFEVSMENPHGRLVRAGGDRLGFSSALLVARMVLASVAAKSGPNLSYCILA